MGTQTTNVKNRAKFAGALFIILITLLTLLGTNITQKRAELYASVMRDIEYCMNAVSDTAGNVEQLWQEELRRRWRNAHRYEADSVRIYNKRTAEWERRDAERRAEEARIAAERVAAEAARQARINSGTYSPGYLRSAGVVYSGGWRYTWYSERILPGYGLYIPGRWSDGNFVRDGDGYLCLASSDLAWGTYVDTPWGPGRVYDCGCASGTLDIYVSW